jgi:protein NEDD1
MLGNQIVASSKVITIHSFDSTVPAKTYCPHRGVINCVSWNHNNKVIASCGIDGKMTLMAADNP